MNIRSSVIATAGLLASIFLTPAVSNAAESTLAHPLDPNVLAGIPAQLRGAHMLGKVPPTQAIDLNVHLAYPHPEAVRAFDDVVNNPGSPEYGHFLTPNQFVASFAPSVAEYAAVSRELAASGITTMRTYPNRKMLRVRASAATIEKIFRTQLSTVSLAGVKHFSNVVPATVPAALKGTVMALVGLDNFEMHDHLRPAFRGVAASKPHTDAFVPIPVPNPPVNLPTNGSTLTIPAGIAPLDMETAYDYPIHTKPSINGAGVTIAIEAAYSFLPSDIYYFWGAFDITHTGSLEMIDPEENIPATFDATDSAEVTVDVEQSTSNSPGANEKVYTVPYALTLFLEDTYNAVVSDASVDVVSTSFGSCESSESASAAAADNDTFQQGSIEGQTMFAAAGDDGSSDCRANGPDSVDFPASSIEVGSAGGTSLVVNADHTRKTEVGWSCSDAACDNGAGGGGVSTLWALPPWQKGLTAASFVGSKTSATMRNVPDVSLNADVNTSYAVWFTGTADLGYGGTSLVGPNLAAIWAQYEQMTGKRMGRAANAIYYNYAKGNQYGSNGFYDITSGTNLDSEYTGGSGFKAGKGYDNDTGWGALDALKLFTSLPVPTGPPNL